MLLSQVYWERATGFNLEDNTFNELIVSEACQIF